MKTGIFLDPSVCSPNMATDFVSRICLEEMEKLFPFKYFVKISTCNEIDHNARRRFLMGEFSVIGGCGMLSSNIPSAINLEWKNNINTLCSIPNYGMGLGFNNIGQNLRTDVTKFYQYFFREGNVSVRGKFTEDILKGLGIDCIDTGCPSTWGIKSFEAEKGRNAIFSINHFRDLDYNELYRILKRNYDEVYVYSQYYIDEQWMAENMPDISLVPRSLTHLAEFAKVRNCDFISARVHSSIFLLRHGIRTIMISTDNRFDEILSGFTAPIIHELSELERAIGKDFQFIQESSRTRDNKFIWQDTLREKVS